MAIQYPEWRKIGREESGVPDWAEALNKGLNLNQNVFKTAYTPRSLENEAQTKEQNLQRNAPYAQNAQRAFEADIGGKEGELSLLNYKKKLMEAQALQAGASAEKAKMIANIYASVMNGQSGEPQQDNFGGGQGASQQPGMPSAPNGQPQDTSQINKQNLVANLLGLKPSSHIVNGQLVTNNPLYGVNTQKVGPSKFEQELSKGDAKQVTELENTVRSAQNNQTTLDSLSDIVSSPQFDEMRQHPILGTYEMGYFAKYGTPEQQNMANQYMTNTGELVKNASRDFRGQFRVGEQALLNTMKPSTSDTAEGARAKTEAFAYMNQMLLQRSEIAADLIRKGMPPLNAYKEADKQVSGKETRKGIAERLHGKSNSEHAKSDIVMSKKDEKTGKIIKRYIPINEAKNAHTKFGWEYE